MLLNSVFAKMENGRRGNGRSFSPAIWEWIPSNCRMVKYFAKVSEICGLCDLSNAYVVEFACEQM